MSLRVTSVSSFSLQVCSRCRKRLQWPATAPQRVSQALHTDAPVPSPVPFRKQLKDVAKRSRLAAEYRSKTISREEEERIARWELTVGIEIHAQLNTERKLFSRALATAEETPNTQVSFFDVSIPGSQPQFQPATVLPALRAALALNCNVQRRSTFDRKHYFYADQPAGYQITQYYMPLARDGYIRLDQHDGIAAEDGKEVTIGIKQIQMEQDTAKTIQQPPDNSLLDYNRVGHPLIEIITLPQIHHPQTAAACVRKIQQVLQAVSSVTTGMELGGLRADVNVSIRPRGGRSDSSSYQGMHSLGTRTEIKNLSSFKAIEDAIIAERSRQIMILESGGFIEGETRGWSLGSTETHKLRGKEGEVDYRYIPDPDLPPVLVGQSLVDYIKHSLPMLPDEQTGILTAQHGLSIKDAKTLVALDGGERLDYFQEVLNAFEEQSGSLLATQERSRMVGNWVLHELGGLLTKNEGEFSAARVPASSLATILHILSEGDISGKNAKRVLSIVYEGKDKDVESIIKRENLRIQHLSNEEYRAMALAMIEEFPEVVQKVRNGQQGKLQWLVGQMIRRSGGRVDAQRAAGALTPLVQPPKE